MSVWNINYTSDLIASMSQLTSMTDPNSIAETMKVTGDSSDYAKILAEKISAVDAEMENTNNNLENQQQAASDSGKSSSVTETIKRFMPDGSIMVTTYDGGSIVQQMKIRPHLVPVPDYSAPPTPSGEPAMKLEARQNLDLLSLLV